jgi:hypothetical protein
VPSAQTAVGVVPRANACRNTAFPVPILRGFSLASDLLNCLCGPYLCLGHFVNSSRYLGLLTLLLTFDEADARQAVNRRLSRTP